MIQRVKNRKSILNAALSVAILLCGWLTLEAAFAAGLGSEPISCGDMGCYRSPLSQLDLLSEFNGEMPRRMLWLAISALVIVGMLGIRLWSALQRVERLDSALARRRASNCSRQPDAVRRRLESVDAELSRLAVEREQLRARLHAGGAT